MWPSHAHCQLFVLPSSVTAAVAAAIVAAMPTILVVSSALLSRNLCVVEVRFTSMGERKVC